MPSNNHNFSKNKGGGKKTSKQEGEVNRRRGIGKGKGERRQYTNKSGKSGHVSPAIVERYLAGIHYPASKERLMSNAQEKGATEDVIKIIQKLSDKTYGSPIDVTKEIGKIE